MQSPDGADVERLAETMKADHKTLERRLRRVVGEFLGAEPATAHASWLALESAFESHLAREEQHVLPRLESALPHEASRIRAEHQVIRSSLTRLGEELRTQVVAEETIEYFILMLRRNAAHEERALYAWAEAERAHLYPDL